MGSPPTIKDLRERRTAPSEPPEPTAPSAPLPSITYPTFRESLVTREQEEISTPFVAPAEITTFPSSRELSQTFERQELGTEVSRGFADPTTPIQKAWLGVYDIPVEGMSETDSRRRLLAMRTAGVLQNMKTGQPVTRLPIEHIQARARGMEGFPLVKGFFEGLKTGAEATIGDVATQLTGRGFMGDPVDFRFPSTFERENDIIWVISGLEPQDVRDIAARTFPEDVPGQPVTDPVQLKEEAEQREAQKLLERAIQISKQPGSTQESIGQMLGSILTLGVGEEPITFRDMNEMNPFLAALLSFPISPTVGVMPLARGIAVPATRFAARQTAMGLSRQTQALTALYTPEAHRLGMKFANYINDIDPIMAGRVKSATVPLPSFNLFGFDLILPGLTRGENLLNLMRTPLRLTLDDELATPVMKSRASSNAKIENVSNVISQKYHALINDAFDFNDKNQVMHFDGIDPTLTITRVGQEVAPVVPVKILSPTIQDIAARLPTYRPHLSDKQLDVLRQLKDDLEPYAKILDEAEVDRGIRADVMEGGFYIPRGRAVKEGLETPVRVPRVKTRGEAPRGPEQPETFTSAAEGVGKGYQYPAIGEVLKEYATYTGERAFGIHAKNYFRGLRDANGRSIVLTPSMLVDPKLRSLVQRLRQKIRSSKATIVKQNTREGVLEMFVRRATRRAEQAEERAEAAAQRALSKEEQGILDADLAFSRKELRTAIADAVALAEQHGKNVRDLQTWRGALNKSERRLSKDITELNKAIKEGLDSIEIERKARRDDPLARAGGLKRTVGAHMRMADQLTTKVDNLSERVEKISTKVDDLIERGDILKDQRKNARITAVEIRKTERAIIQKKLSFAALNREMRVLARESDRANRFANQSGEQLRNQETRRANTEAMLTRHQEELDEISVEWDNMIKAAKRGPRTGYAYVDLPGMQGHSFPEEMAAAINKIMITEGPLRGIGQTAPFSTVRFVNRLLQGLETTVDMSGIGIQGLAGMYANQRAWASAVQAQFQAWGVHGDRVLGRFIAQYDNTAKSTGRLTAGEWAGSYNLSVRGAQMGELQVPLTGVIAALGRVPGIKQANRAFGFFGDTIRLEWADDMLQNELSMGKTLEQLRRNGDLERIAEIANNMTGYSRNRTGGDWGELLLFAPRFLQARLSTVAKAATGLRPGAALDQRIARRSMLKMVGSAVMLTHFINWMNGHETDMRPWVRGNPNSNFMRARVGNRDFSLLGTWDSLAKGLMLTSMGRPHEVLRTLSSPVVRVGWDVFSGSTAIGERTREVGRGMANVWSPKTGYYAIKTMTPFAFQEIPEAARAAKRGDILTAGVTIAGETFGLKSGALSYTDQKDFARRQMFPDTAEKDLTVAQKRMINEDKDVQTALLALEDRRAPMNLSQVISSRFDTLTGLKEKGESELADNILRGLSGDDLRQAIKTFKRTRFDQSNILLGDDDIQAEFKKKSKNQNIWDTFAQAFWMADAPSIYETAEGRVTIEIDFDARDDARAKILDQADDIDEDIRAYITGVDANGEVVPIDPVTGERNTYRGKRFDNKEVREMIERFEADQEVMKPYLQARRDLAEEEGLLSLYREWRASNDSAVFLDNHPLLKAIMARADRKKIYMRENDVNLERKLWMWGYITTAKNSLLEAEIRWLRKEQGGEITNTLAIERELAVAP